MKTLIEFDSINHLPTLKHALDEMLGEGTYRILPQARAAAWLNPIPVDNYAPLDMHISLISIDGWTPLFAHPIPVAYAGSGAEAHSASKGEAVADWTFHKIIMKYCSEFLSMEQCRTFEQDLVASALPAVQAVSDASALATRLLNAVGASEFGGITCLDIDGEGNWFDVRDRVVRLLAAHTTLVAQTGEQYWQQQYQQDIKFEREEKELLSIELSKQKKASQILVDAIFDKDKELELLRQQPPQIPVAQTGDNYLTGHDLSVAYSTALANEQRQPPQAQKAEGEAQYICADCLAPLKAGHVCDCCESFGALQVVGTATNPPSGYVAIQKSAIDWLLGESDHPQYGWFERPEGEGKYWWRDKLRAAILSASTPAASVVPGIVLEALTNAYATIPCPLYKEALDAIAPAQSEQGK